jgi:hypothetical protein
MWSTRGFFGAAGGFLVSMTAAESVRADATVAEPIRVLYDAPVECPNANVFVQNVFARTDRARLASGTEPARRFEVTLERFGAGYRAALRVTGLDGAVNRREITGEHCGEVASAAALATVLAVDPGASMVEPEATETVSPAPPTAEAPPVPTLPLAPPRVPPPQIPEPMPPFDRSGERIASSSAPVSRRWSVGADAFALAGSVPSVAWGSTYRRIATRSDTGKTDKPSESVRFLQSAHASMPG